MHGPPVDITLLLLLYMQPRGGREGERAIRPSQLQDEALGLRECRVFPTSPSTGKQYSEGILN